MNSMSFQGSAIATCTCTHGGGGHMVACDFFVPNKEQYVQACKERDELREVVKVALAVLDGEPGADDRLFDAINGLNVVVGTGETVRPWWLRDGSAALP